VGGRCGLGDEPLYHVPSVPCSVFLGAGLQRLAPQTPIYGRMEPERQLACVYIGPERQLAERMAERAQHGRVVPRTATTAA
jgi:hypothetical protein